MCILFFIPNMIIYPPLPLSPLSPTIPPSPSSPLPVVLVEPKSKPQLHTHLHHQTYNSLLSLPLAFSITPPSALLSPSNLRTARLELNLYFAHNRACTLLRDLDDFFTLKNGRDGISPPVGQSPPLLTPAGSLSPQLVAEKIDRLKELLFQWERILPLHNAESQEGQSAQYSIDDEGWKEWWEERRPPTRGLLSSGISPPAPREDDETDDDDVPFVPNHRTNIPSGDDTDDEDTTFVPDHRRNTMVATSKADDVVIGIGQTDDGGDIPLFLVEQEHRINIAAANKDRLRVLRSRNHHHRFKATALISLLQQFLGQVLQKEMGLGLSGLRNENAALEHFLRRREGDCGGR
ncbi:hypothetical protein B0T21DRAFT_18783 [Apiosordaria backusii]|uniref:Uncharacterized protein n=1 Tax=Apiosordaria backusii TaxID=314023 RepID=A0AA40EZJ9_9PEZI|nr:hypothetical protein B0T21DRAFT_18783 [Apiosordaria backusii]